MALFWILAALMTLAALAFVLVPLLRALSRATAPSVGDASLEVLRAQRREIEADIAAGTLPADARDEALAELVERAGHELPAVPIAGPGAARKPWGVVATVAVALPALAFGLYAWIGSPAATQPLAAAARAPDEQQIVAMVETLALRVRGRPDDVQGWALLSRSMSALGRFPEAAAAYEHLAKIVPGDAQVLADWADALGMAQAGSLAGRPAELAHEALKIDPRHKKALALAATAALDAGDPRGALGYWQRLGAELDPESADAAQVRTIVAQVEAQAGAGKSAGAAPPAPARTAADATSVTGSVTLAPALAAKVSGTETLFVFARSEGGPRVPLAVVRASARELPLRFALDDSHAMAPGATISSAAAVRIEARLSRSGNAAPQPGDLVGTSAVVKPGARGVAVVVDRVLP